MILLLWTLSIVQSEVGALLTSEEEGVLTSLYRPLASLFSHRVHSNYYAVVLNWLESSNPKPTSEPDPPTPQPQP